MPENKHQSLTRTLSANKRALILIFASFLFFGCGQKKEVIFHFTLGHLANEDHTWHLAAIYFDSLLNTRTAGKVRITVYPNEQLGKEVEMIRSIRAGITDMTITAGTLQNWCKEAAFAEMPFLLHDTAHLKLLVNGAIGNMISDRIMEQAGLRTVCYFQRGPRHLTSNRPVRHPSDLKGMIIRVPNVPSYVTAWQSLGAKPTPMAFSEVFTSLQQGTVEAQENPLAMISSANFAEVQQYLNLTGHVLSWVYVVIGARQFDSMPEAYQEIFLQAALDMQEYEHKLFLEKEDLFMKELISKGMKVVEVDVASFTEVGSNAVFESLDDEMQHFYMQIKNL